MSRDGNFNKDLIFDKSDVDSWKNRPPRSSRDELDRRRRRSGSNDEDSRYKSNYRSSYGRKDYFYDRKSKRGAKDKYAGEKHDRSPDSRLMKKDGWDERRDSANDRCHPGSKFAGGHDSRRPRSRRRRSSTSSSSSSRSRSRSSTPKRSRRGRSYSSSSSVSYSNESPQIVSVKKITPGVIDCDAEPWQGGQPFSHCGYPPKQNTSTNNGRQFGSDQQMPISQFPGGLPRSMVNQQFSSVPPPRGFQDPLHLQNQFIQTSAGQPSVEGNYSGYQGEETYSSSGFDSYQGYDGGATNPHGQQTPFFQPQLPPPLFNNQPQQQSPVDYNVSSSNWSDPNSANHSNLIYPGSQSQPQKVQSQVVEDELLQQKRTLIKQREEYLKKNSSLQRELSRLKDQRKELLQENNKDSERFLRENTKLQNEICQRLKAIENVIEMLSGLIGDYQELDKKEKIPPSPSDKKKVNVDKSSSGGDGDASDKSRNYKWSGGDEGKRDRVKCSSSPEIVCTTKRISCATPPPPPLPSSIISLSQLPSVNIHHYDPELHWCSLCNLFPKTFQDYLNHLHTPQHRDQIFNLKLDESPWHADIIQEAPPPYNKNAPTRRVPIRGVQFLVPCSGWYCRLCKSWIGDLHCASEHLKGSKHTSNYSDYISQNPHWEVDWLSDRTRSYEKTSIQSRLREAIPKEGLSTPDDNLASEKAKINALSSTLLAVLAQQNKVKPRGTKHSSSSSSDSSSDNSPKKIKKSKKKKSKKKKKKDSSPDVNTMEKIDKLEVEKNDDNLISEWMENENKSDNLTLDLKGRMKQKTCFAPRRILKGSKYSDDEKFNKEDGNKSGRYMEFRDPRRKENRDGRSSRDSRSSRERKDSPRENRRKDDLDRRSKDDHEYKSKEDRKKSPDKCDKGTFLNDKNKDFKSKIEKPQGKLWFPNNKVEEEETSFEKQAAESAAKKKAETRKPTQFSFSKTKLPFIGRMPILKKKPVDSKVEEAFKDIDKEEEKETKGLVWPDIPSTECVTPETPQVQVKQEEKKVLPKSTLIISKRPRLAEPEEKDNTKANIIITADMKKKTEDNLAEQDMDIECDEVQDTVIWEANEDNTDSKEELHKDFKDALDLLFPEEGSSRRREPKEEIVQMGPIDSEGGFSAQEVHGNWIPSTTAAAASGSQLNYSEGNYPSGYPSSTYYGPGYDGNYSSYYQGGNVAGYPGAQSGSFVPPPTHVPPPTVPPPPPMISSAKEPDTKEDDPEGELGSSKKKNPLSQRMRRHLHKKRWGPKEEVNPSAPPTPTIQEEPKKKYEGMDISDLAMLGIDEDDSIAQQF